MSPDFVPESRKPTTPPRVAARPSPAQWAEDELLSLPEAAALFWPDGPLSTSSLRTAHRKGQLAVTEIAGKFLTTKAAIRQMSTCELKSSSTLAGQPAPITPPYENPRERATRMVSDFRDRVRQRM